MDANGREAIRSMGLSYEIDNEQLLGGVDMEAVGGQFVGLIGPNGAGKTTLLRTIAGVVGMSSGEVLLEGADLASLSAREVAERLALVPQIAPYTHGFNVIELVLMGRYPHLGRFQIEGKEDARVVRDAMRQSETETFADRTLETLSGGERQRVFIARALAQQPRILLMDEPTANLDVLHQFKVMDIVRGLVDDGLTAVAAIHDLNMAARYCDRLVVMSSGRVIAQGGAGRRADAGDHSCGFRCGVRSPRGCRNRMYLDLVDWSGSGAACQRKAVFHRRFQRRCVTNWRDCQ